MQDEEQELSILDYFVPLTTRKAAIFIFIVGFLVFGNTLFNQFVWDDIGYIIQNPLVHTINIKEIFGPNMYNTAAQYRPLPALYFALIYSVLTTHPFLYHVLQIVLHCINSVLVYILFKKFFSKGISLFLSFIFLVHPLQIESVSYIASTGNPLFFMTGIIAVLLSFKAKIGWPRLVVINIMIVSSMLFKETGLLFVFLVLFVRFLFKKGQIALFGCSLFATLVIYYLLRASNVGGGYHQLSLSPIAGLPFFARLINIPAVVFYYLKNFIVPNGLVTEQLWVVSRISFANFYGPLLFEIALFVGLVVLGAVIYKNHKKTFPAFLLFIIWSAIGFGMYSQVVPLDMTVADRWFYFPIVGLLGLLGCAIHNLRTVKFNKQLVIGAGYIVIIFLSLVTNGRNTNWRDGLTLYSHDSKYEHNYDMENNLGTEYFNRGDYKRALSHFLTSEKMLPYELNTYNVAVTYQNLKDANHAEMYYTKVISMKKYAIDKKFRLASYVGLSQVLTYMKEPTEESVKIIERAVGEYPDNGVLWSALAVSYKKLGNTEKMIEASNKAAPFLAPNQQLELNSLLKKQ